MEYICKHCRAPLNPELDKCEYCGVYFRDIKKDKEVDHSITVGGGGGSSSTADLCSRISFCLSKTGVLAQEAADAMVRAAEAANRKYDFRMQ